MAETPTVVSQPAIKNSKPVLMTIIIILSVILLIGAGVFGGYMWFKNNNVESNEDDADATSTDENIIDTEEDIEEEDSEDSEMEDEEQSVLIITNPESGEIVDGQIAVSGNATALLQEITARAYDQDYNLLGETVISLASGDSNPVHNFSNSIDITVSPVTNTGIIYFYPTSEGEGSELLRQVDVLFKSNEFPGRLKVYAPLDNQILTESGGDVIIRGEMKDFFEATVGLRIRGGMGGVLFDQGIYALSDNYDQWAPFETVVHVDPVPSTSGGFVTWEFYETSMMDGSETVLLSIPIRMD